jgi:hypothetical protein
MDQRIPSRSPILAALNIHSLPRRWGVVVPRAEVNEALAELNLEAPLPRGRLLKAERVELILSESGISVEVVQHRMAAFVMQSSSPRLQHLPARIIAAADPNERTQLKDLIHKVLYRPELSPSSCTSPESDSDRNKLKGTKRNQNPRKTAQKP